uniref:Uncharacterized protein n=1 Tax=Fagus sylvatica TaxID=28930 RepID=A0A2N9J1G9_FAGSY
MVAHTLAKAVPQANLPVILFPNNLPTAVEEIFLKWLPSSSLSTQEGIDLNDTPSVMQVPTAIPEVWRPYFLSPNGPVSVTDSVMLNGVTATAVAADLFSNMGRRLHVRNHEVRALRSQVTILQRLLKESKKKVGEVKDENKRLKVLVDSYAEDLVARSTRAV